MGEQAQLTPEDVKTIRQALKCPAGLVKSTAEKTFIKETRERLEKFGDKIYLSSKQLEWLRKIASRSGGAKAGSKPKAVAPADDLPEYGELAGE